MAGLPSTAELEVAKYRAAEGGQRVVHAASHIRGEVGVDRDHPLHRHFLLTRQIELTLGVAFDVLARLGAIRGDVPAGLSVPVTGWCPWLGRRGLSSPRRTRR